MSDAQRNKWNDRYCSVEPGQTDATQVVVDYRHLLPHHGRALDLACGLGANALLLARQGLVVDAWDISDVAINKLAATARAQQLSINARCCDVMAEPLLPQCYDVIVVSRFLERRLCPALAAALKPGGLLFYQTWTVEKLDQGGPNNPHYLLLPNELLQLFAPLRVIAYREEGRVGDQAKGVRNEALLVAQCTA